jgi:hypothetical protein
MWQYFGSKQTLRTNMVVATAALLATTLGMRAATAFRSATATVSQSSHGRRFLASVPLRQSLTTTVGTPATSFDDGQRPFQITTPIYYVNDKPHIGHAYTSTGMYGNAPRVERWQICKCMLVHC